MKHLLDLCAFCFFSGKLHHDFSQRSEVSEKDFFGSFSVRSVLPVTENLFTYAVDENFFFEFHGCSPENSKPAAPKTVRSRKSTTNGTR
ncbi:MAG TPA: hypothetical protein VNW30_09280 [Opitutaceae bacterium]|jgi:hypothetical protein|nr:hypothetical protein [Opitutaceae bacterium]